MDVELERDRRRAARQDIAQVQAALRALDDEQRAWLADGSLFILANPDERWRDLAQHWPSGPVKSGTPAGRDARRLFRALHRHWQGADAFTVSCRRSQDRNPRFFRHAMPASAGEDALPQGRACRTRSPVCIEFMRKIDAAVHVLHQPIASLPSCNDVKELQRAGALLLRFEEFLNIPADLNDGKM
jgi:hypothetical protein